MSEPATMTISGGTEIHCSGRWITAREAADRSGLAIGHINRQCLESWQHNGLAKRGTLPSGQTGWLIDEAADVRFAVVKSAEQKDEIFDPAKLGLTDAQTAEVMRRRRIVSDWSDAVRASAGIGLAERQVTEQFLARLKAQGSDLSRRTLYNWLADWRRRGVEGLIDARWRGQRGGEDHAPFMVILTQLYLDRGRRKPLSVCYEIAADRAAEQGLAVPSARTAYRLIGRLDPAVVARYRQGEKAYVNDHEPFLARDYSSIRANDWWCADDTQVDVIVRHGTKPDGKPNFIRPFLHAWQDLRSRRIVGWELSPESPTTQTVLRTWVAAADAHGIPGHVLVDNGKHFDSQVLQGRTKRQRHARVDLARCEGAWNILTIGGEPAVRVVHAWPFRGQSKPIERWFGTMEMRFAKTWDSYCGRSPAEKPEDLSRRLEAGQAPTLEEFRAALADWIEAYNATAHRGDSMDGQSPDAVFAATLAARRTLPRALLEFATFQRVGPVMVRQNGVTWQGLSFGQFDQQLARLIGKKVRLALDDRDLSRVYVLDLDGRLITQAPQNQRVPFGVTLDNRALRDGIAEKKRLRRSLSQYQADRPRMSLDVPDLAIRAARNRAKPAAALRATGTDNAAPMQIVRTPFDDQLTAIQRAAEPALRIAPETTNAAVPGGFRYHSPAPESEDFDD